MWPGRSCQTDPQWSYPWMKSLSILFPKKTAQNRNVLRSDSYLTPLLKLTFEMSHFLNVLIAAQEHPDTAFREHLSNKIDLWISSKEPKHSRESIEKAIVTSDLGLSPNNDGNLIRLTIPALTEDRRKELVKIVHKTIEEGRVAIRNLRREANEQLKTLEKNHDISEDNLKSIRVVIQRLFTNDTTRLYEFEV